MIGRRTIAMMQPQRKSGNFHGDNPFTHLPDEVAKVIGSFLPFITIGSLSELSNLAMHPFYYLKVELPLSEAFEIPMGGSVRLPLEVPSFLPFKFPQTIKQVKFDYQKETHLSIIDGLLSNENIEEIQLRLHVFATGRMHLVAQRCAEAQCKRLSVEICGSRERSYVIRDIEMALKYLVNATRLYHLGLKELKARLCFTPSITNSLHVLSHWLCLESLDLHCCRLSEERIELMLKPSLDNLTVKRLRLVEHIFTRRTYVLLGNYLERETNLQCLHLCQLSHGSSMNRGVVDFSLALRVNSTLRALHLENVTPNREVEFALEYMIKENKGLEHLSVVGLPNVQPGVVRGAAYVMVEALCRNTTLLKLDLQWPGALEYKQELLDMARLQEKRRVLVLETETYFLPLLAL